ncbi:MAG: hypothetical protein GDA56_00580 [Hormoscilla sp. GM7CHS1pb]|nr:hypothetical protein [Hormoscilla sp. GM7CHS1pb]
MENIQLTAALDENKPSMPEDANNNHGQQPDIPALPLEPWSMEAEADRLIEDLFEEVDRVLDGGTALPKEPVQPEYLYLQPMDMQSIGLPLAPHSPQESLAVREVEPPVVQRTPAEESALTEEIKSSGEIERVTSTSTIDRPIAPTDLSSTSLSRTAKPVGDRSVRKLVLLLVSTCLGVPLLIWLNRQGVIEGPGWQSLFVSGRDVVSPSREEIQARIEAEANARFAQYMQQTLASIDQNPRQGEQVATVPDRPTEINFISPESGTNRQLSGPNRLPTVLERVYIPVYQPPRPASQPGSLPLPPPPSSSDIAALPPPPPLSNITLPPLPGPPAIAPKPISLPDPPPVTSNATETLVGILKLGDRSAALFDIDGVTHRFRVGDNIGESSWKLVEISQQEAIVERNGQLRSIYVGQKL